jgi:hypothetical protein
MCPSLHNSILLAVVPAIATTEMLPTLSFYSPGNYRIQILNLKLRKYIYTFGGKKTYFIRL